MSIWVIIPQRSWILDILFCNVHNLWIYEQNERRILEL